MRAGCWLAVLTLLPLLKASVPQPADWVPVRWPWADTRSLELLAQSPINCLLLGSYPPDLVAAAADRGLVTLAVIAPGGDPVAAARQALAAKVTGLVLEGEFAEATLSRLREVAGAAPVVELAPRNRLRLGSRAPILGTYQGVWPGITVEDEGAKKAGPTASVWIDTNTGFIRAVRAWGDSAIWIANQPPPKTLVTGARYLQVIADAAISGGRWVIAFDADFAGRLAKREADTMSDWRRINSLLRYFEAHPEWRAMRSGGKLAVVQDEGQGGLVSGGILDMIAVKHTPLRPIPRERLTPDSLAGAAVAVNVDADGLTPDQKEALRAFTRSGGTLLTGPPGWKDPAPGAGKITLERAQLERLNDIWRDVNATVGRRNLGVRLFNVSSMLSNLLASPDGKTAVLHLVNFSDYPVENVTAQFLGNYKHATLLAPDSAPAPLEIYQTEDGGGVDIAKVSVCATVRLEQ